MHDIMIAFDFPRIVVLPLSASGKGIEIGIAKIAKD